MSVREVEAMTCPDPEETGEAVLGLPVRPDVLRHLEECPYWTYPALVDRVTLTDSGFADHLLSNSSGDRYPRAECRRLRL